MKRWLFFVSIVLLLASLVVLQSCGGSAAVKKVGDDVEKIEAELEALKAAYQEKGGIAAIGMGVSKRRDIARDKAISDAQGGLAESFEVKVSRLRKSFIEEVGSEDTEINEAFSIVTKSVASKLLRGAIVQKTRYLKEDGKYTAYVLTAITPETANQSLLDEMKSNRKLYERFRASKAYEELNKEVEDFEKWKKNQQ